jgi:hypothetical protein
MTRHSNLCMQTRLSNVRTGRALLALALLASCTANIEDPEGRALPPPGSGGSGGTGGNGSGGKGGAAIGQGGTTGVGGMPIIVPVAGNSSAGMSGTGAGEVCQAETREGRRVPIDMYFLVDSSGSMAEAVQGGSRWEVVSSTLVTFLEDPRNAEIGVGIGYFPNAVQTTCTAGQPDCLCIPIINLCFPNIGGSCLVPDYSTPAVPIALPPAAAPVVANIQVRQLSGGTPTRPAVEGALQYVEQWSAQHPDRKTILVLATDGEPTGCDRNLPDDVAALAAAALAGPQAIQTFVIGVGDSLESLNAIAVAGGSGQAFLVDTGGDVATAFADALDAIRGVAAPCDFLIPAEGVGGEAINPAKVNVRLAAGNSSTVLPQVDQSNPANCGPTGGWYYDNPSSPKTIKLCPASCEGLAGGSIQVEFGCDTVVEQPH